MQKKLAALAVALLLLTMALASCMGNANKETITVWAAESVAEFTRQQCAEFLKENPELDDQFRITVVPMGEGETATQLLTDVEAGAEIRKKPGYVIFWPEGGEDAWTVGKRYGVETTAVGPVKPGEPVIVKI